MTVAQGDQLSFTLTHDNLFSLTPYITVKIIFQTLSYNNTLFIPDPNVELSNVNGLTAALASKYTLGTALNMSGQAISNVGGIVIADSYRINDINAITGLSSVDEYSDSQMLPRIYVQELINRSISSGGG